MKNKKLQLKELSLKSFNTSLENSESKTIQGGLTPGLATIVISGLSGLNTAVTTVLNEHDRQRKSHAQGVFCPIKTMNGAAGCLTESVTTPTAYTKMPNAACRGNLTSAAGNTASSDSPEGIACE